ncbi:KpsF/GutQ family sugar-phosphate isomerase [Alkalilacustris brevis]|uniref:KpsF/GutQ family sugar-phosphate isomerase n=1 Tax=Alkalilacustris brevis TaxID=2026338 RepID=UPI000E0DD07E|nr:KpsF/GutQ family sugar-phosphate isomerase [Alkalilacustris brevis]
MNLPDQITASGRRVLEAEGAALMTLAQQMPADFPAAVQAILEIGGRVIVSGIGKSGHVGHKIAATLASTGTPAHFVHATEASHGDLGMITPADICLLISNSGETPELRDIVAHTRRFSIPLIAISSRAGSALMEAADLRLLLPQVPEACAIGMAPTTSTTLTLALGDALAVALMEQRDFQAEQFRTNHPGGRLGAQLVKVGQLMHVGDQVPLVQGDTPMPDVLIEMTSKGFGIAGVTRGGRLVGAISDGDLRRNMARLMGCSATDVATPNPQTVGPGTLAAEAVAIMNRRKIGALFVVSDEGAPLGILHIHDCLRAGVA